MKQTIVLFIVMLTLIISSSGCVSVKQEYPPLRFYVIDAQPQVQSPEVPNKNIIIQISRFESSPLYEHREFVYRKSQSEFVQDYYNKFFVTPGEMLTAETLQWLQNAQIADQVILASSRLQPTHYIDGIIYDVYGDWRDKANAQAVLTIQIYFYTIDDGINQLLYDRTYSEQIPVADKKPESLVEGFNQALTNILSNLQQDIKTHL